MDPRLYPRALKLWYQQKTGVLPDLGDPKTYNEKIQWLKLNDRDPRKTLLTDKYLVRDYVREKIGEEFLIPLLGVYRRADEIDFGSLPDVYVLKPNHASGMKIIVRAGQKPDPERMRKTAESWLKINYAFENGFELNYKDIQRRLLVEKYLRETGPAEEYKLYCFNGKCRLIERIIVDGGSVSVSFYGSDLRLRPFGHIEYPPIPEGCSLPGAMPEMIRIAETLAAGFIHVRTDLYLTDDGEIKFGEMTFYPGSGILMWDPPEADLIVGKMLELPR